MVWSGSVLVPSTYPWTVAVSGASARYATSFVPRSDLSSVMRVRAAVSDPGPVLTISRLLGHPPVCCSRYSGKGGTCHVAVRTLSLVMAFLGGFPGLA